MSVLEVLQLLNTFILFSSNSYILLKRTFIFDLFVNHKWHINYRRILFKWKIT